MNINVQYKIYFKENIVSRAILYLFDYTANIHEQRGSRMEMDLTFDDISDMLKEIGYKDVKELFEKILPKSIMYNDTPKIPMVPEKKIRNHILNKLRKDRFFNPEKIYLGGGVWPTYIPSIVSYIISRTEFLTSYTPYQAEISQGTMQALYEYQSIMAELLDMDVVNSSMYDWASAAGEALLMSYRIKKKPMVLVSPHIAANRKKVIETYLWGAGVELDTLSTDEEGNIDIKNMNKKLNDGVSGVYIEYPNSLGYIYENLDEVIQKIHEYGALVILGVDPVTLPIIKPPGELDADIAVGEGQPLGLPMSFGGPLLGIFAVRGDMILIRNMPGRIIGLTRDIEGNRAFAMILQTREQHIRREKATSNICTNEALSAIASAIYLSLLGKDGLLKLSTRLLVNAHKLREKLLELGFEDRYALPFIREFSLKVDKPIKTSQLIQELADRDILFGRVEDDSHVISINEYHDEESFDELMNILGEIL